jgi:hypothetical protein
MVSGWKTTQVKIEWVIDVSGSCMQRLGPTLWSRAGPWRSDLYRFHATTRRELGLHHENTTVLSPYY